MNENGKEKFVTYPWLIGTALVCLGLAGSLVGWAYSAHASQPHVDAVSQTEIGS